MSTPSTERRGSPPLPSTAPPRLPPDRRHTVPNLSRQESCEESKTEQQQQQKQPTTHCFIRDPSSSDDRCWVPAELISRDGDGMAVVLPRIQPPASPVLPAEDEGHPPVDFTASVQKAVWALTGGVGGPGGAGSPGGGGEEKKDDAMGSTVRGGDGLLKVVVDELREPEEASGQHQQHAVPPSPLPAKTLTFSPSETSSFPSHPIPEGAVSIDLKSYPNETLPLRDIDSDGRPVYHDDMVNIPYLHEPSILYNLRGRYEGPEGVPYTRTGDIIVAINPYRWIKGLYAESTRQIYAEQLVWRANPLARTQLPPHLYETSSLAFRGLILNGLNQSILVSGESGAGKTVSVKILMSHLATFQDTKTADAIAKDEVGKDLNKNGKDGESRRGPLENLVHWLSRTIFSFASGNPDLSSDNENNVDDEELDLEAPPEQDEEPEEMNQTNRIVQRVLDSNPLLEAFGNAKTTKNDNSSRFGKYVKLQFHVEYYGRAFPSCNIAGSVCETYLLEKSRVVGHETARGERTFHIFYQLLAAPEKYKQKLWDGLSNTTADSFKYVGGNTTRTIEGLTDAQRWRRTVAALNIVGVKGEQLTTLMRALCAVLQLGNLIFGVDPSNDDGSVVTNMKDMTKLSDVLGVKAENIINALTLRTVKAGREVYKVPLTPVQAKDVTDAFAKEIYARAFGWLVNSINDATCAEKNYYRKDDAKEYGIIGLLDIFGFESFEINHFETLCVNFANEKVQSKFTQDVFRSVRSEYESEGIDLCEVHYDDNSDVLRLIEDKMGMIDLLNEECLRPKGSDAGFVNKIYATHKSPDSPLVRNRRYLREEFGVRHYAGLVKYDARKFVTKNVDNLSQDVAECALTSTNALIRNEFLARKNERRERKGSLVSHTVWTKFKSQLSTLMSDLSKTQTWYVRCINPNTQKLPGVMDVPYAVTQLRYAGIVSAVTMSRSAFPNRLDFKTTLERFRFLASFDFLKAMKIYSSPKLEKQTSNVEALLKQLLNNMRGTEDKKARERRCVEVLLDHLLKDLETRDSGATETTRAYVCGKTKVYFRTNALEYLEAERLVAYDRCATVIQSRARRNLAVTQFDEIRLNPPARTSRVQENMLQAWLVAVLVESNPIVPWSMNLWRNITNFPAWVLQGRSVQRQQEGQTQRRNSF